MDIRKINLGGTYLTEVSGKEVPVVVMGALFSNNKTTFRVRRVGNATPLRKRRTADQLNPRSKK